MRFAYRSKLSDTASRGKPSHPFRKPHRLGWSLEPIPEVRDSPSDLRVTVTNGTQGKNGVTVGLRNGAAVPVMKKTALSVRLKDARVGRRSVGLQPGEKRGSNVEIEMGEIVDDVGDMACIPKYPRVRIGRVAFRFDTLVPVVKRSGRSFAIDRFSPRVVARRLIKMGVKDDGNPVLAHELLGLRGGEFRPRRLSTARGKLVSNRLDTKRGPMLR